MKVKLRQNQKPKNRQRVLTPEFKKWVNKFMDEHEEALKELAKR